MNELDREMELMERADRRDAAIQRAKALRQQEQQEKAKAKEVCSASMWLRVSSDDRLMLLRAHSACISWLAGQWATLSNWPRRRRLGA